MAVAQALQSGFDALRRNPSIAGVVLLFMVVQIPLQFAQLAGPLVSTVVGLVVTALSLLITPFVFGGLLGMAAEGLDGKTRVGTFVRAGKEHYVSMFGAYLVLLGASIVLGLVAAFAMLALGVTAFATLNGAAGGAVVAGIAVVGLGVMLVMFVPLFFIQFYGQAIVLSDEGAVGGFRRSVRLVRRNLKAVFGYSVLVFGGGMLFGALTSVPSMLLSLQRAQPGVGPDVSLPIIVGLTLVGTVLMGLFGSFFLTFSVAFYRRLDSVGSPSRSTNVQGTVA